MENYEALVHAGFDGKPDAGRPTMPLRLAACPIRGSSARRPRDPDAVLRPGKHLRSTNRSVPSQFQESPAARPDDGNPHNSPLRGSDRWGFQSGQ